ncbi:Ff.00g128310.m01.CDS01 [Fusarium sp. VM40]|nr:Ff.00g128310.m01.CDS01 [Fusarium sp. VM40]
MSSLNGPESPLSGSPYLESQLAARTSLLLNLPPELIDNILSYLSPYDLSAISGTCRDLHKHALSDVLWHPLVQENVPGVTLTSSQPCDSYHELYIAHDRFWFLPRQKIWFCDRDLTGRLMLVRYDPRRGCIEGYQLLASRGRPLNQSLLQGDVLISEFDPKVKLHLDKPILQFRIGEMAPTDFTNRPGANRFADEMPITLDDRLDALFSNFMLTCEIDQGEAKESLKRSFPYGNIWPPPSVPSEHHVSGSSTQVTEEGIFVNTPASRPWRRQDVSERFFRVRQWMEMAGGLARVGMAAGITGIYNMLRLSRLAAAGGLPGVHVGEELITYSTLDPKLYTPTPLKPWRGIWVGDYSTHGCEFLLVHQPDDENSATDEELGLVRRDSETEEAWEARRTEGRTFQGRLEAIKLTGDPNVPRGEITFVADDLGPDGVVDGPPPDPRFLGIRTVYSQGHIANTGFTQDRYVESQLILVSHDRLAQHWIGFGHVSYFQRVDIDEFLKV